MVWKRLTIACLVCVLAAMLALPAAASALPVPFSSDSTFTPYDGVFSPDVLEIAKSAVWKFALFSDYAFVKADDGFYALIVGDLTYDGEFTGSHVTVYGLVSSPDVGYYWLFTDLSAFTGVPNQYLIFSNLGPYPDLISGEERIGVAILFALVVLTIMFLVRGIFSFTLRTRATP